MKQKSLKELFVQINEISDYLYRLRDLADEISDMITDLKTGLEEMEKESQAEADSILSAFPDLVPKEDK